MILEQLSDRERDLYRQLAEAAAERENPVEELEELEEEEVEEPVYIRR